jgi:predicted  nucleic acid-binding Zn-ribbon protein
MSDNGNKPTAEEHNILQQRYDSLVKAIQKLELTNAALEHDNQFLRNQLLNAEQNIAQQKANLINAVTTSNQTQQDMASEISILKAELRENGDNSRLGD